MTTRDRCRNVAPSSMVVAASLLVVLGVEATAAPPIACALYRFKNADGVLELSNSIPPDLANDGYSCLNKDGAVVQVVPPKLAPGEQAQRDRELEAEKAAKDAGLPRPRTDEELMKLYSSPRDVEEARERTISAIDAATATSKTNLESLRSKRQRLEEQAADRERAGLALSEILADLQIVKAQIDEGASEIEGLQLKKQHAVRQFELDLDRVRQLYPDARVSTSKQ